jgi:Transposase DDE domain
MKCNTEQKAMESGLDSEPWQAFWPLLPAGWEEEAYRCAALVRRRGIGSARALLQLILAYAVGEKSLRQVGLWGTLSGVAAISDVAILKRLRQSKGWLEALLSAVLQERMGPGNWPRQRIHVVDATSISRPGHRGTDWRVHLSLDLAQMQIQSVKLTDVKEGEGLRHFALAPGELLLADRAYGTAKNIAQVLAQQATCVVRMRWSDFARYQQHGQPFDVIKWLQKSFGAGAATTQVVELQLLYKKQLYPLRLVACSLPQEQAEQARRRAKRKAQRNQVQITAQTLVVADFVLFITNLPAAQWSAHQIVQLYRLRWQVELYFKRLKSIIHLDHLRARDPKLASVYLLAKLLAALLLDRLSAIFLVQRFPYGNDLVRPLSLWQLTALLWTFLTGLFTVPLWRLFCLTDPLRLRRYLCNSPRKRLQQDAFARLFVRSLSVVNVLYA